MPIRVLCSTCGKRLSVREDLVGRKVKCPACGNAFVAASVDDDAPAVETRVSGPGAEKARGKPRPRNAPPHEVEDGQNGNKDNQARRGRKKRGVAPSRRRLWAGILAACGLVVVALGVWLIAGPAKNGPGATKGPARQATTNTSVKIPQADAAAEPITFPELGPARLIKPGIQFQEATLQRGGVPMRVWYYQPEKAADKLALVLVPPAGSTLFLGMDLGDGDRTEHYPYAKAGFAVASFEIDGNVANVQTASDPVVLKGARAFRDAQAGLANAKAALDFVLAKVPNIDPGRVYIAGHSSAATLALLVAEHEPRIKACAAYAPVTDVETRLAEASSGLDRALPGFREFLRFSSPKSHADKLTCPVFLFHARDDSNVPSSQSANFAALLKKTNPSVTLVTTLSGGHYESMIREGIPKGIAWLKQIDKGGL